MSLTPKIITRAEREAREAIKILPSNWQMVKNLGQAAGEVLREGIEKRTQEEKDAILEICKPCSHFISDQWGGRCGQCGCKMSFKVSLKAWHCPIGKW